MAAGLAGTAAPAPNSLWRPCHPEAAILCSHSTSGRQALISVSAPSLRPTSYDGPGHTAWETVSLRREEGRLGSQQRREAHCRHLSRGGSSNLLPQIMKSRKKTMRLYCMSPSSSLMHGPDLVSGGGIICHEGAGTGSQDLVSAMTVHTG